MEKLYIVIPAYNEEANIEKVVRQWHQVACQTGPEARLVVVNDAHIPMDGTPREVFSHGEELEAMGLAIPQVTRIFRRLKELGLPVDASVYTTAQAVQVLEALKGGGAVC